MMTYDSVIIHLSDIECGENNRADSFTNKNGYAKIAQHLVNDLHTRLFEKRELKMGYASTAVPLNNFQNAAS
jgi:hypothetical protein